MLPMITGSMMHKMQDDSTIVIEGEGTDIEGDDSDIDSGDTTIIVEDDGSIIVIDNGNICSLGCSRHWIQINSNYFFTIFL